MRKVETLTFNETTYTFVQTENYNGVHTIFKNGVSTEFLFHFQQAYLDWYPNRFTVYIVGTTPHYIPAETDEITLNILCEVINIINFYETQKEKLHK
jgi:hypothetical protein